MNSNHVLTREELTDTGHEWLSRIYKRMSYRTMDMNGKYVLIREVLTDTGHEW